MPTPFQHLSYGDLVLNHPDLPPHLRELLCAKCGAFLLGTTATDVQSITGQRREETHFYRLSEGRNGSPADKMLSLYPELAHPQTIPSTQAAFITGYLVHLAWDEPWAWDVFVPFYRDGTQWSDPADSGVRDSRVRDSGVRDSGVRDSRVRDSRACDSRIHSFFVHHNALRVWLDRIAYADLRGDPALPGLLQATLPDHWLPFVPDTALSRWRDWLVEQLLDPAQVQTAEVFADRLQVPVACLEHLVAEMESGSYTAVPGITAALKNYEAAALTESLRTVLRYWGIDRRLDRMPVIEPARSAT